MNSPNKSDGNSLKDKISRSLHHVALEARELYLDSKVPEKQVANPLEFYRDHVAPNKPVLIKEAISHWPALQKWNAAYLRETLGDVTVTVAVTPNGFADAVTDGKFVMPEERQMKMSAFLDIMDKPEQHQGIFYIQKQNSNLTDEFSAIIPDVETDIPLGSQAFGKKPDAVNFWMGDGRAVTSNRTLSTTASRIRIGEYVGFKSGNFEEVTNYPVYRILYRWKQGTYIAGKTDLHRDHYENLYCVISGHKTFCLLPPTDLPFVPYEMYQAAHFKESTPGKFNIIDDSETGTVPWIAVDPCNPDLKKYPDFAHARPVEVTVHAGQMLYLPSLWFHHVQQSHGCIAVNFWYDMEFDIKYNYYKFLESVSGAIS